MPDPKERENIEAKGKTAPGPYAPHQKYRESVLSVERVYPPSLSLFIWCWPDQQAHRGRYEYQYEPGVSGSLCILSIPVHCHCMVHMDHLPADHPIHPEDLNAAPGTIQNHPGACTAHTSPVYCNTIIHGTALHRPPQTGETKRSHHLHIPDNTRPTNRTRNPMGNERPAVRTPRLHLRPIVFHKGASGSPFCHAYFFIDTPQEWPHATQREDPGGHRRNACRCCCDHRRG